MRSFIEWLEENTTRTRKVLALFTAIIWLLTLITAIILHYIGKDLIAILSLVTGQFTAVIGFYMGTKASTD